MVKPEGVEGHFYLSHLKRFPGQVGIFFNCLVNLNKFIAYETRDLFAIKVMDKAKMVDLNVADFIMNERNILNKVDNDFIVRGMYTF